MFQLIKGDESKISVDREKCQMMKQTCCARQERETRAHFALNEGHSQSSVLSSSPTPEADFGEQDPPEERLESRLEP